MQYGQAITDIIFRSNLLHHLFLDDDEDLYLKVTNLYQKTIRIKPTFVPAYEKFGKVYERIGKISSVIKLYQDALKYNPHSVKVFRLLIECHEQYGEYNYFTFKNIIESYKKLSLIEADNPVNHFELGSYNLLCNQFDQAV